MSTPDPRAVTETDEGIGVAIRSCRKQRGVPMAHVAELVGITVQQFQKYESGQNRVSAAMLTKIAEALEIEPAELLPGAPRRARGRAPTEDGMAMQLQHAFGRIKSKRERRLILDLAKRLAAEPSPRSKKSRN